MNTSSPFGDAIPTPGDAAETPAPRLGDLSSDASEGDGAAKAPAEEEVDVWWGSCAGRAMLPSFLTCLVLTAFIVWGCWLLTPRGWKPVAFLAAGSLLWAAEGIFFFHCFFGYNYRVTTHRLFVDRGVLRPRTTRVPLGEITQVSIKMVGLDRWTRLGQIRIVLADRSELLLPGVRKPAQASELLSTWAQKAREREKASGGCKTPPA
jgi:membrane protein YdbS with pleckstrin-like domain